MTPQEIEAIRESAEYHFKTGVSKHGYYSHETVMELAAMALSGGTRVFGADVWSFLPPVQRPPPFDPGDQPC